jgi:uncharacterized protein (DUF1800 family)
MADLTAIGSWDLAAVQHFARRAGFGIGPEAAAALAAQSPGTAIDAWIDGASLDTSLFDAVWADRADPVAAPGVTASTTVPGSVDVPAVPGPHRYLVDGAEAWRNDLARGQASWAFRMQFHPYAFRERMALFWHNLFATGWHKVNNVALMLKQIAMLRAHGLDRFDDLLVLVSKDPAMCLWLDSVLNNANGSAIPNENYAREVMELYSLGADNGYNQVDIAQLARALSGWSFTVRAADVAVNPASPNQRVAADGLFAVYDGGANPAGADGYAWYNLSQARATLPDQHGTGTIAFLGQSFNIATAPAGMVPGEDAVRSIVTSRPQNCSEFLANRLLTHFVTARFSAPDRDDVAAMIRAQGFDLRAAMKLLLKSRYFFDVAHRFALVEGPVSWTVRAARMLGPALALADAASPKGFPSWALVVNPYFDLAGMKLLDPNGPNGWKEDASWLNSNTIRYRTKLAAAVALAETATTGSPAVKYTLFPTDAAAWFPVPPTSPAEVFDRLVALLQPAPIPDPVRAAWLAALWPGTFTWDAAGQTRARELAFLVLCSPAGQLY